MRTNIGRLEGPTGNLLDLEVVERKGQGHPDTVCDGLAEELSLELSRFYLAEVGRVLHYNVDKVLLWGGAARPAFGGGRILKPMEIFLAGRATTSFGTTEIPIAALAEGVAKRWFATYLPTVEFEHHVRVHALVREGSADLSDLFTRDQQPVRLANDTSCGIGYAPLSRLETVVYNVEKRLGALAQRDHPEIGRDIKVMGVRRGQHIHLTIACAFVDRFLRDLPAYMQAKAFVADVAQRVAVECGADATAVEVNTADDPSAGSVYLTVTGTSAEAGDDGEAGRGNRINGLIAPFRPMTMESVAGKNAVTHVGKLYNIAASLIAQRLVTEQPGIEEAQCVLVSQIGRPLDQPQGVKIDLRASSSRPLAQYRAAIARTVEKELLDLGSVARRLASGSLVIGCWPLTKNE